MARQFDKYRIKRGDNLGDPGLWNARLEDLDVRLHARELDGAKVDGAVESLTALALQRLNDTFTPLIDEATQQLENLGARFEATSLTENTAGLGEKTFVLTADTRLAWVTTEFVVVSAGTAYLVAEVLSYERPAGLLIVDVVLFVGSGTHAEWTVRASAPPDLEHTTRTDNPHATTAAQTGAYTVAQTDALLAAEAAARIATDALKAPLVSPALTGTPTAPTAAAGTNTAQLATMAALQTAIANLVASSPAALDTLNELAAALGNDANYAATITAALALKAPLDSPAFTGTVAMTRATTVAAATVNGVSNARLDTLGVQFSTASATDVEAWLLADIARVFTAPAGNTKVNVRADLIVGVARTAANTGGYFSLQWRTRIAGVQGAWVTLIPDLLLYMVNGAASAQINGTLSGVASAVLDPTVTHYQFRVVTRVQAAGSTPLAILYVNSTLSITETAQ